MEHVRIPVRVLGERLSSGAKVLFGYVYTLSDEQGRLEETTQGEMARACGMTRGAVSRALSELVAASLLKMSRLPSDFLDRKPFSYIVDSPAPDETIVQEPSVRKNGKLPLREIVIAYNTAASKNGMAEAKKLTKKRRGSAKRLYETLGKDMDSINRFFGWLAESDFYGGANDRGWKANFDYVCEERVVLRYLEKGDHAKPDSFASTYTEKERLAKVFDDARRQVQNFTSRCTADGIDPREKLQEFWGGMSAFLVREGATSILPQIKQYVGDYWRSIDTGSP